MTTPTPAPPSREAESWPEQLSRVQGMAAGDPTWDLSENDCAALQAVLAQLQQARQERDRILEQYRKALAQQEAALQQAREALEKYGRHQFQCAYMEQADCDCTCGLDAVLHGGGR